MQVDSVLIRTILYGLLVIDPLVTCAAAGVALGLCTVLNVVTCALYELYVIH